MDELGVATGHPHAAGSTAAPSTLLEVADEHPGRFLVAGGLTTRPGPTRNVRRIRELARAPALLAWCASCRSRPRSPINDARHYPVYQVCEELGIPVGDQRRHPRAPVRSRVQHPELLEDVLIDFPDLVVIGAHMGHPYEELLMNYMRKWPNLYLSCTAYAPQYLDPDLVTFMNTTTYRGRVLWGSDEPWFPMRRSLAEARALPLDDDAMAQFLGGTARRLLDRTYGRRASAVPRETGASPRSTVGADALPTARRLGSGGLGRGPRGQQLRRRGPRRRPHSRRRRRRDRRRDHPDRHRRHLRRAQGGSESQLGEVLEGRREHVVLATKFGMDMGGANGPDWGARGSRRYIRRAVEASLRRLRTDWIDLYQYHAPDGDHADRGDRRRARRARARRPRPLRRLVEPRGVAGRRRGGARRARRSAPASSARRTTTTSSSGRPSVSWSRRASGTASACSPTSRSRAACSPASTAAARPPPKAPAWRHGSAPCATATFDALEQLEAFAHDATSRCSTSRSVGWPRSPRSDP